MIYNIYYIIFKKNYYFFKGGWPKKNKSKVDFWPPCAYTTHHTCTHTQEST